jgi:hypothetical protein
MFALDQWWEHIANNKMTGIGTPSSHNKIPRPMLKSSVSGGALNEKELVVAGAAIATS